MNNNEILKQLSEENYNLAAIFKEFCNSKENRYIEQCQQLSTLADIMFEKCDKLLYKLKEDME